MTIPIDWYPTPEGTKELPALVVPPIPGVLPFEGAHNPLTRSNTARRVSMVIPTPATKGVPQVYHFDGEREMAVALEALLSPGLFRLEVQLPKIYFDFPKGKYKRKNWPGHHFDLRLTFSDGLCHVGRIRPYIGIYASVAEIRKMASIAREQTMETRLPQFARQRLSLSLTMLSS